MFTPQSLAILEKLSQGIDPFTERPLPTEHLCQHRDVVRALCAAVYALRLRDQTVAQASEEDRAKPTPSKANQYWTKDEEDRLALAFDAGATI